MTEETRYFKVNVPGHDHILFANYHRAADYCYNNGHKTPSGNFVDLHTANIKEVYIQSTVWNN
jgi:hypothetical protein